MTFQKFSVFMLGFAIATVPASATISYQTSQASFTTQAETTDSLLVSSLTTFTGALTTFAGVANDEYVDATTGIEFIAFNGTGSANVAFTSVSGGVLSTLAGAGDTVEVMFPNPVDFGFAFNFTTPSSGGLTLCVDISPATFSNCASGGTFISQNGTGFIGALDDNGSLTTLTSLWLHPLSGGSAATDLQSFEVATEASTPESATMLLIGIGLITFQVVAFIRKRKSAIH